MCVADINALPKYVRLPAARLDPVTSASLRKAGTQTSPLVPIHVPTLRHLV
jgi:hypothetical protein